MNREEVANLLSQEDSLDIKPLKKKKEASAPTNNGDFLQSVLGSLESNPRDWVVTLRLSERAKDKMNQIRIGYIQKGQEFRVSKVLAEIIEKALQDS